MDAKDSVVQARLQLKYPPRFHNLPETVIRGQAVENLRGLRDDLVKLQRGVGPGVVGAGMSIFLSWGKAGGAGHAGVRGVGDGIYPDRASPYWF